MKKVVLASLLACAVLTLGLTTAYAQTPVQLGSQAAPVQMPDAEYTVYNNAMTQTNLQAKAAAIEDYLTKYPNSSVKQDTLVTLMTAYSQFPIIGQDAGRRRPRAAARSHEPARADLRGAICASRTPTR